MGEKGKPNEIRREALKSMGIAPRKRGQPKHNIYFCKFCHVRLESSQKSVTTKEGVRPKVRLMWRQLSQFRKFKNPKNQVYVCRVLLFKNKIDEKTEHWDIGISL